MKRGNMPTTSVSASQLTNGHAADPDRPVGPSMTPRIGNRAARTITGHRPGSCDERIEMGHRRCGAPSRCCRADQRPQKRLYARVKPLS
jgi:hypothetical protein